MTIFNNNKIFHFPLKIFVSSKIFEKFAIFEDLWRIFELTKIPLWSIFRNRRIFVFVFGPFSIFVATLLYINHAYFLMNSWYKFFIMMLPDMYLILLFITFYLSILICNYVSNQCKFKFICCTCCLSTPEVCQFSFM